VQVLTHQDVAPEENPTGEELLHRSRPPYKFWVPTAKSLVIGHSQDPERELRLDAAVRDGIPVHRRMGGGGAVLLSPGCVCVGLRFARSKGRNLHDYFAAGSGLVRRAVREATGLDLESMGISDLACPTPTSTPESSRKVVGCSLYMPRDFALYLASILVSPDLGDLETYLAHPSREPGYRAGRPHGDFVAGLDALAGRPGSPGRHLTPTDLLAPLEMALAKGLDADLDWPET
jgi:lipoate---protein ligase